MVTFLLGNGFDLSCGLRSSYKDVYQFYVKTPSNNDIIIKKFKEDIERDSALQYETWGDFEMGMALYAKSFKCEDDFIKCVRDFKRFLHAYLVKEEGGLLKAVSQNTAASAYFYEFMRTFYKNGFTLNDAQEIKQLLTINPNWHIISFNYTNKLLHSLCKTVSSNAGVNICHVHGTLEDGIILGVDNEDQFKDLQFPISRSGQRTFIKPVLNEQYSKAIVEAAQTTIHNSSLICVFGVSFGNSDYMWKKAIKEWLLNDQSTHLVYYKYGIRDIDPYMLDDRIDEEEAQKTRLCDLMGFTEEERSLVFSRIHIPISRVFFNIQPYLSMPNKVENKSASGVM